jgi:hypothetical protein
MLGFDHQLAGRGAGDFKSGERIWDAINASVPADAPAGTYEIRMGLYDPGNGLRLHPDGLPGHISFVEAGRFEVCP